MGREHAHNMIACQEIIKGYKRKRFNPRCIMNIDLRKAYDLIFLGLGQ